MNYRSKKSKIVTMLLVISMIVSLIPVNRNDAQAAQNASNGIQNGLSLSSKVDSEWEEYHITTFTITNSGAETVQDWCVAFKYPYEIKEIWNADIVDRYDGYYIIKNLGWNQDISAGSQIVFGCVCENIEGAVNNITPSEIEFIGEEQIDNACDYNCEYRVTNDWGHGFNAELIITNKSDHVIEDWSVEFEFDNNINSAWNGIVKKHEGNHYVISNAGYNQNISKGQSISVGFNISNGTSANKLTDCVLRSYNSNSKLDIISISDNELYTNEEGLCKLKIGCSSLSGTLDRAEEVTSFDIKVYDKNNVLVFSNDIFKTADWNTGNIGLSFGENTVIITARIGCMTDTKTIKVYQDSLELFQYLNVDWEDPDGDTLPNYIEEYFGTDKFKADTDGDGVSDFDELNYFGYDPKNPDTDGNGISDYDEDCDEDGLINGYELSIGSDPVFKDTDGDGLRDKEEIDFGTSPIIEDTDGDGINDYDEYRFSRLNVEYDEETGLYTCVFNAEEYMNDYDPAVVPTIKIKGDKKAILTFEMNLVEHSLYLNYSMTGYMGSAYDFKTDGMMSEAELTYTYNTDYIDEAMLTSEDFCPTIYYFNEETTMIEEVPGQVWEGNKITVKLEHFSSYVLANKADLVKMWSKVFEAEESGNETTERKPNDIIFIIDRSGSMSWNDTKNIRADLLDDLCYRIKEEDRVALYGFDNYLRDYSNGFLNSKTDIKNAINKFRAGSDNGGTYLNQAIYAARDLFSTSGREETNKIMFILTDGETHDSIGQNDLENIAGMGIKIYTVGMGSVNETYLKGIANSTNGDYYYAKDITALKLSFDKFEEDVIDDGDINDDNLPDCYARSICAGDLTTYEGTHLFSVGYHDEGWEDIYNELQSSADYDEDGLLNGEEIEIYIWGGRPWVRFNSNPELIDTDSDLYSDFEEVKKYNTDPKVQNEIMNEEVHAFIYNYDNFESAKEQARYLGQSDCSLVFGYLLNALLGGELDTMLRTEKTILNMFVGYGKEVQAINNTEDCYVLCDTMRTLHSVYSDILPYFQYGAERKHAVETINLFWKEYDAWKTTEGFKHMKKGKLKTIRNLEKRLNESAFNNLMDAYGNSEIGKRNDRIGYYFAIATTILEILGTSIELANGYSVASTMEHSLNMLCSSNDKYVRESALRIEEKLYEGTEWYRILLSSHNLELVLQNGFDVGLGFTLGEVFGLVGIITDIVVIFSGIILGKSLEADIQNNADVSCSIETKRIFNSLYNFKASKDMSGNPIWVANYKEGLGECLSFWMETILYCEEKYLEYLEDFSLFFDASHYFEVTDQTYGNTYRNTLKLRRYSYGGY